MTWKSIGPDNYAGRCRAIMIDNQNPNKIYAGGVTGGLFVSTDGGSNWEPHAFNYEAEYPGVVAMTQAANGDIYIAGGEAFGYSFDGVNNPPYSTPTFYGSGIYKSTDGGNTFVQCTGMKPQNMPSNDPYLLISALAVKADNPNIIYAATHRGLKVSFDGGNTANNISGLLTADLNRDVSEVVISGNTVHACINNKYYRSTDSITFENRMGLGGFPTAGIGNFKIAVSPQDTNYIYAIISTSGGATHGFYRSTDNGLNWSLVAAGSFQNFNPLGSQGQWNISIVVDPTDKEHVLIGGQLEIWRWRASSGLQRIIASTQTDFKYFHQIVFKRNLPHHVFFGCAGGIYLSKDINVLYPVVEQRNDGFRTTMFYNVSAGASGKVLGGVEDGGTQLISMSGPNPLSAERITHVSDYGFAEVSAIDTNLIFVSGYGGELQRTFDGGNNYGCFYDARIDGQDNCHVGFGNLYLTAFRFFERVDTNTTLQIDSFDLGNNEWQYSYTKTTSKKAFSIIALSANTSLWICPDASDSINTARWFPIPLFSTTTNAMTMSDDFSKLYVGNTRSNVFRIEGLFDKFRINDTVVTISYDTVFENGITKYRTFRDTLYNYVPDYPENSSTANWNWTSGSDTYQGITKTLIADASDVGQNRWILGIDVFPNDADKIMFSVGGYDTLPHVYFAHDTIVTPKQNNLKQSLPVYDVAIDRYNSNNVMLGTDIGIWSSDNGGSSWSWQKTNFTHVPVFRLQQAPLLSDNCMVIYAATFGRGIYRSTSLIPAGTSCDTSMSVREKILSVNEPELKVYPNPAETEIKIEIQSTNHKIESVVMYDVTGKTVSSSNTPQPPSRGDSSALIDVRGLTKGLYFLHVELSNGKRVVKKVVKE